MIQPKKDGVTYDYNSSEPLILYLLKKKVEFERRIMVWRRKQPLRRRTIQSPAEGMIGKTETTNDQKSGLTTITIVRLFGIKNIVVNIHMHTQKPQTLDTGRFVGVNAGMYLFKD